MSEFFGMNHKNMFPVRICSVTGVNVIFFFFNGVLEMIHRDFQTSFNLFLPDQCKQHVFNKDQTLTIAVALRTMH